MADPSDTSDVAATDTAPLTVDERAELERLRARVAELSRGGDSAAATATTPRRRVNWRAVGAITLIILAAVLTLLSVTTRFVRAEILDTDHYVATVTPLASNPAVQQQVTDSIVSAIDDQVDLQQVATDALTALTEATPADRPRVDQAVVNLAPLLSGQAQNLIQNTVSQFVTSSEFQNLWVAANREAHQAVVAAVTGNTEHGAVKIDTDKGSISISLGPIIEQVKQRLVAQGFSAANSIPAVDKNFVIWQSPQLLRAQNLINALDTVATALPWLAIAAILGAIVVAGAGRRLRTLTAIGVVIVLTMLLLAVGVLVGRAVYLNEVPADVLSPAAAQAIFDTVINPLRTALRAVALVGLVLALIGFFAGGSRAAQATRSVFTRAFGAVDDRRADRAPSSAEKALWTARIPIRIAIPTVGAFILMFWEYPTGVVVFWVAVIAVLAAVAFEFAIAPARRAALPH